MPYVGLKYVPDPDDSEQLAQIEAPPPPIQFPHKDILPTPPKDGQDPPPDLVFNDAIREAFDFIAELGPDRGPFKLERQGQKNEMLPGVSLPPWIIQILNHLCGHPTLPYHHDRQTMHRDLLLIGALATVQALQQYRNDPELEDTKHIIWHEANLRRQLYADELLNNDFIEDLAVLARLLDMKMKAGQTEAVYEQLKVLFDHLRNLRDKHFWRPILLSYCLKVPEIRLAISFLAEHERYRIDPEFQAWQDLLQSAKEQEIDLDQEYPNA